MSKESFIAKMQKKADEQTLEAERLEEAIGEGGSETFSEEQLFHMRSQLKVAYSRVELYNKVLADINKN